MASTLQQQSFQRKLIYLAIIMALLSASWVYRSYVVEAKATELGMLEENRGNVKLAGAAVRLSLTGSRGLAICILWNVAMDLQKKNKWSELELVTLSLSQLQPHFISPWMFQSWNLAYNVSVEADRVRDKYFYIVRGI